MGWGERELGVTEEVLVACVGVGRDSWPTASSCSYSKREKRGLCEIIIILLKSSSFFHHYFAFCPKDASINFGADFTYTYLLWFIDSTLFAWCLLALLFVWHAGPNQSRTDLFCHVFRTIKFYHQEPRSWSLWVGPARSSPQHVPRLLSSALHRDYHLLFHPPRCT